jgi:hypothetical protein
MFDFSGLLGLFADGGIKTPPINGSSGSSDITGGLLAGYDPEEEKRRRLSAFGNSLLANSGYSTQKRGIGEILGQSMQAGDTAQEDYRNSALQRMMLMNKMRSGGNTPAAMQMANEVARLEGLGTPEGKAQAARIREFAKTAAVQTEYNKGLIKNADGTFNQAPGYGDANAGIKGAEAGAKTTATENAKNTVDAQSKLPGYIADASNAMSNIDNMVGNPAIGIPEHPGLSHAVGTIASKLPTLRGSTADFENRLKQVQGQTFLDAYQNLRGGGAITEAEGAKATAARNRMVAATSEDAFRQAAAEYKQILQQGITRAQMKAGVQSKSSPSMGTPSDKKAKFLGFE